MTFVLYFNAIYSLLAPSSPVNVQARAESHHEIIIQWESPKRPNGEVTHYVIDGFREKDSSEFISQRNYCSERKYSYVKLFTCLNFILSGAKVLK